MSDLDLTTATPAEIDNRLFPAWERIAREQATLKHYTHKPTRVRGRRIMEPRTPAELAKRPDYEREQITQIQARIAEIQAQILPLEAEYERRGGWSRVFIVTNADGHVHRDRSCATLHSTTEIAWMPQLSGLDDDGIIAAVRETACTVCYPDAPTHPAYIHGETERLAAEQAKADRKCPGSGTPVQLQGSEWHLVVAPSRRCPVPECRKVVSVVRSQGGAKLRAHERKNA